MQAVPRPHTCVPMHPQKPEGPYKDMVPDKKRSADETASIERSVKRQRPNVLGGHVLIDGKDTFAVTMRSEDQQRVIEMQVQTVGATGPTRPPWCSWQG